MRRNVFVLVVACWCAVGVLSNSSAEGNDRARTSMFRALTSEQSEGPALAAPVQQATMTEPVSTEPVAAPPVATEPATAPVQPMLTAPTPVARPNVVPSMPMSYSPRPTNFYGGLSAQTTLSQLPRRASAQPRSPRSNRRQQKPFEGVEHEPTLSPYLNLDQDEDDTENVPTYFTLVRPRIEQLETNRLQQREIQQLRGQVQSMAASGIAPPQDGGQSAGRTRPAMFMNTAQFYGGR
jgi:hypothetical protein